MEEAETSEDEAVSEAETEESQVQDYAGPKQLSIQVTALWMKCYTGGRLKYSWHTRKLV